MPISTRLFRAIGRFGCRSPLKLPTLVSNLCYAVISLLLCPSTNNPPKSFTIALESAIV